MSTRPPAEDQQLATPTSVEQLAELLAAHGVATDSWGAGEAKTLAHLHQELREGETTLRLTSDGQLLRCLRTASLHVHATDPSSGQRLLLVEDRQEFADGRVRRRKLSSSLGEKMTPQESPLAAVGRALAEELGASASATIGEPRLERRISASQSYPGLCSRYDLWHFDVELNDADFRPEGYVEHQDDKQTIFVWQTI